MFDLEIWTCLCRISSFGTKRNIYVWSGLCGVECNGLSINLGFVWEIEFPQKVLDCTAVWKPKAKGRTQTRWLDHFKDGLGIAKPDRLMRGNFGTTRSISIISKEPRNEREKKVNWPFNSRFQDKWFCIRNERKNWCLRRTNITISRFDRTLLKACLQNCLNVKWGLSSVTGCATKNRTMKIANSRKSGLQKKRICYYIKVYK